MVAESHSIQSSCRVLDVAESSFYAHRTRVPSARAIRHAWLTDLIVVAHTALRGTYGARRVHAELSLWAWVSASGRLVLRRPIESAQFTSWAFTRRAQELGLVASMGSIGDCFDNSVIESFWGRMQTELSTAGSGRRASS